MSWASRRPRRGFTLVEMLVCLVLLAWLGTATLRGYAALRTAVERTAAVASAAHAHRVVRSVLRSELTTGAAGVDWTAHPPDSIRLRAFRAAAIPCRPQTDSTIVVALLGGRVADPSKDSVLVLTADGVWEVADLVARAAGECAPVDDAVFEIPSAEAERWTVRPAPSAPTFLRIFETGSYHLADQALRYRRGAGGRQPLTESVFRSAEFVDSAGSLGADVDPAHAPRSRTMLARSR